MAKFKNLLLGVFASLMIYATACGVAQPANVPAGNVAYVGETAYVSSQTTNVSDYRLSEDFQAVASRFGADLTAYTNQNNYTLKHNGNEPIYVYVGDMTSKQKSDVVDVLNYYNQIYSNINSHYNFQVVSKNKYDQAVSQNKAAVSVEIAPVSKGQGVAYLQNDPNSQDNIINGAKICMNNDYFANDGDYQDYFKSVFFHEMAHVVGLNDVYFNEGDYVITNTATSLIGDKADSKLDLMLTPNDYRIVYSKYYVDNGENRDAIKAFCDIAEYDNYYYQVATQEQKHHYSDAIMNSNILNYEFSANTATSKRLYDVTIAGDSYSIIVSDGSRNYIETVTGKCVKTDGVLYLENVRLSDATIADVVSNNPFVGDLTIYQKSANEFALKVLNGDNREFSYTLNNQSISSEQNSSQSAQSAVIGQTSQGSVQTSRAKFTESDFKALKKGMWYFKDGSRDNFAMYIAQFTVGQKTINGMRCVDYEITDEGLHLKNMFRGDETCSGNFTECEAWIYKDQIGEYHFVWADEPSYDYNMTENRLNYTATDYQMIGLYTEKFDGLSN